MRDDQRSTTYEPNVYQKWRDELHAEKLQGIGYILALAVSEANLGETDG